MKINIFVLDLNPAAAARMHCDKHIPKMIVESAQMLSTAHRILDGEEYLAPSKSGKRMVKHFSLKHNDDLIYKAVHAKHPCTLWTMQSYSNYIWHYGFFRDLSAEFKFRFGKVHQSWDLLKYTLQNPPKNISMSASTDFALAMPDVYKVACPVESYRNYYIGEKARFAKWERGRAAPDWWNIEII